MPWSFEPWLWELPFLTLWLKTWDCDWRGGQGYCGQSSLDPITSHRSINWQSRLQHITLWGHIVFKTKPCSRVQRWDLRKWLNHEDCGLISFLWVHNLGRYWEAVDTSEMVATRWCWSLVDDRKGNILLLAASLASLPSSAPSQHPSVVFCFIDGSNSG